MEEVETLSWPNHWIGCAARGLLAVILPLFSTLPAAGEFYPLPPWFFYGGGNGNVTWNGTSTSPDNAQLSISVIQPPMPNHYVTAVGTASSELLQMTPGTTYTFTLSAMVSGSAACEILAVDGSEVISHTLIFGAWKRYTNSFTTGGPSDPRVGRSLNVQLLLMKSGFNYGAATANFTNLQFQVETARPTLTLNPAAGGTLRLQWPTNFSWYVPEHTTSLEVPVWESLTNAPIIQGNQFVVPLEPELGQRYFRLRQPE